MMSSFTSTPVPHAPLPVCILTTPCIAVDCSNAVDKQLRIRISVIPTTACTYTMIAILRETYVPRSAINRACLQLSHNVFMMSI